MDHRARAVSGLLGHLCLVDRAARRVDGAPVQKPFADQVPVLLHPNSEFTFVQPRLLKQPPTDTLFHPPYRSHGFCIGHVVPEAQVGGPIALVKDGDVIAVDAVKNTIELQISEAEMAERRAKWVAPPLKVNNGTLYKYAKLVQDASHGCVTDA